MLHLVLIPLALGLAALPAPTALAAPAAQDGDALVEALRQYRAGALSEPALRAEARARIGGCRAAVLDALHAGRLEPDGDAHALALEQRERELLLANLDVPSTAVLFRELKHWIDWERCCPRRLIALEVVAAHGKAREVPLAFELATWPSAPSSADRRSLREAFEEALVALLRRDPASFDALDGRWSRLPEEQLLSGAKALGRTASPRAARPLLALAAGDQRALGIAIAELGRLGEHVPENARPQVLALLTRHAAHEHAGLRAAVARALGSLGGRVELRVLATMLDDPAKAVVHSAHGALLERTGLRFRADAARWTAYLDEEAAWLRDEAHAHLAALGSSNVAEALAALRELGRHPLFTDELLPGLLGALEHDSPTVRIAACRTLQQGRAREAALLRLAAVLRHDEDDVARAAWDALRALTDADLPFDPDPWDAHLRELAPERG